MANEKRLIDANAVPKLFEKKYEETEQRILDGEIYLDTLAEGFTEADDVILSMPTVDAVEVVHGRWEWYTDRCEDLFLGCDDDYGWRCSKCKVPLDDEDDPEVMPTFRYCPNCGAKMDGDGDD